jgi:hypothetical protein
VFNCPGCAAMTDGTETNIIGTSPPIRSLNAAAAPR